MTGPSMGPAARAFDRSLRLWQAMRAGQPSPCRFTPTCSAYGRDAVAAHGALRGVYLTLRRLSRCHPWGAYGFDPVPERL